MPRGYVAFILVLCQLTTLTYGAVRVDARKRAEDTLRQRRSRVEHFRKRDEGPLSTTELFHLTSGEALEEELEVGDALGGKVERLQEVYKGIKVYDAVVTVRKSDTGELTGDAAGTLIQEIDKDLPDTEPTLSARDALYIMLEDAGNNRNDVDDIKVDLLVYVDNRDGDKAKLVYIISYLIDGYTRPFYIIDANTGVIIEHWEGLNTYPCCDRKYKAVGGNEKMGKVEYGNMPFCIVPAIENGICSLENEYVRVVDMQQTSHKNITETISFVCEEGYDDDVNGAFSPAIDAFFYGTVVGKMFEDWFGGPPLKSKLVIRVHFLQNMQNAFWNGENCTFGDGGIDMYPLTSLDVVGHEIGHGVTEQASNLVYHGESGGVNEAFSDIIGEASEAYLSESDFMTGNLVTKTLPYLREFENPENDNSSIRHVSEMNETIDVHYSSGIFRRVWFVLVKQQGMPIRDAAKVFVHANKMYWHSTASFYDCSCGVLMAAIDLGYATEPFEIAFKDVGLQECDIEGHVLGLNNNRTVHGVTVGETIRPMFKMKLPPWADTFYVDVTSKECSKGKVSISVTEKRPRGSKVGCGDNEDEYDVITKGVDHVTVDNAAEKEFFMQFSLSTAVNNKLGAQNSTSDEYSVDIIAGYSCQTNFSMFDWFYIVDCGLELPDY